METPECKACTPGFTPNSSPCTLDPNSCQKLMKAVSNYSVFNVETDGIIMVWICGVLTKSTRTFHSMSKNRISPGRVFLSREKSSPPGSYMIQQIDLDMQDFKFNRVLISWAI